MRRGTAQREENALIRQAISCDICGTEKKQTNHWFIAWDQGGELRVSGWQSRNRTRPGSKHLCGQTCLHKLVDEFMARTLTARAAATSVVEEEEYAEAVAETNASLTSKAAYVERKSGTPQQAQVVAPPRAVQKPMLIDRSMTETAAPPVTQPIGPQRAAMEVVSMPVRPAFVETAMRVEEAPVFRSRQWRAAAWERERERESRSTDRQREAGMGRRTN